MTLSDVVVLIAAALSIGLVNWYFLGRKTAVRAVTAGPAGVQRIAITVHGGYAPSVIEVERGRPVRMTFDRQEDNSCSEEIVLPAFGIRRFLPAFQHTVIEFTPTAPGDVDFTCGMSMLRGTIRVR